MLLALAMFFLAGAVPGPSANDDIVRAVYYAASSIIVAMAVLVWASE